MTTEYSVDEMLRFYEETVKEIAKTETSVKKAVRTARKALKAKYPDSVYYSSLSDSDTGIFWNNIQKIVRKYYPKYADKTFVQPAMEIEPYRFKVVENKVKETVKEQARTTFMDIMRCAANSGFIPSFEYIEAFLSPAFDRDNLDMRTKRNIEKYLVPLRAEGYVIEQNGKGWNVTPPAPKETPEEKERREIKEQLAVLMDRLNKIGK